MNANIFTSEGKASLAVEVGASGGDEGSRRTQISKYTRIKTTLRAGTTQGWWKVAQ